MYDVLEGKDMKESSARGGGVCACACACACACVFFVVVVFF